MSIAAAMTAATTTFDGNAALVAAVGTGKLFWMRAKTTTTAPYIVAVGTDETEDDSFALNASKVLLSFNIYTSKSAGPTAQTTIQSLFKTAFHKVQPAGITGYTFGKFARVGGFMIDEPTEFVHFVEQYAIVVFAT
jgi:hypothetical protein